MIHSVTPTDLEGSEDLHRHFQGMSTKLLEDFFSPLVLSRSVERSTPGEEVMGSNPAVTACSLLVGSMSV